eukprot:Skav228276  [mRNA]  locus=scaffold6733:108207:110481:- [translate_table: standard]
MESVESMDKADRDTMSLGFGGSPMACNASDVSWCHRPRLYWLTWELQPMEGLTLDYSGEVARIALSGRGPLDECIKAGWTKVDPETPFPTFTTSRPRAKAGHRPAGVQQCNLEELQRWHEDAFRFPPYQYLQKHCLTNAAGTFRLPDVSEREVMLGFPLHYTVNSCPKSARKTVETTDTRLTLLGNTWSIHVVAVLLGQLFSSLGWICPMPPSQVVKACRSGTHSLVQGRLHRLPLNLPRGVSQVPPIELPRKLGCLLSMKGEDVLLSTPTSQLTRFHRLRASVPGRLWRWRVIAGWRWSNSRDHINSLELRAILTTFKWRLEHQQHFNCRMLHLTDSLVCGVSGFVHGSDMPKSRLLEGVDAKSRATQRQRLGTLRELTVQPATRRRYERATQAFFEYLNTAGIVLPTQKSKLDPLVCDFIEHLWSSGAGRAQACDTLAGLQDSQPSLRNNLPGAWRLLKTWSINEVPNRAPPLPEHVVQSMVGWALLKGHVSFGVSLMVGFYGMLRTGELCNLRSSHMVGTTRDWQVLISLGFTKGGKRQGAAESVILGFESAVSLVKAWKLVANPVTPLVQSTPAWRARFSECLKCLDLEEYGFRPYSLRRGGATFWFSKHQSLDRLCVQGRWASQKTARIYINEGLSLLTTMNIPASHPSLRPFIQLFAQTARKPKFSTLEPPSGRAGGRGRARLTANRRGKVFLFSVLRTYTP